MNKKKAYEQREKWYEKQDKELDEAYGNINDIEAMDWEEYRSYRRRLFFIRFVSAVLYAALTIAVYLALSNIFLR